MCQYSIDFSECLTYFRAKYWTKSQWYVNIYSGDLSWGHPTKTDTKIGNTRKDIVRVFFHANLRDYAYWKFHGTIKQWNDKLTFYSCLFFNFLGKNVWLYSTVLVELIVEFKTNSRKANLFPPISEGSRKPV